MSQKLQSSSATLLWRLLKIARPYWLHLCGIVLLSLLATPITLLNPVPIKIIVDNVVGGEQLPDYLSIFLPQWISQSKGNLLLVAVGLIFATPILFSIQWTASWLLQTYTGEKLVLLLRSRLFRHVQEHTFSFHDIEGSTSSTYRIQFDATSIESILIHALIPLLTAWFPLISIVVITLHLDWQLAIIALATAPFLVILVRIFGDRLRQRWNSIKGSDSQAMSVVQEVLSSIRIVKAFRQEDREQERFEKQTNIKIKDHIGAVILRIKFEILLALFIGGGTAAVLYVGVLHVQQGILSLGELIMIMTYIGQIFGPLQNITKTSTGLASSLASAERVFIVLDKSPQIVDNPGAKALSHAAGKIKFEGVTFAYNRDNYILKDISFEAKAGSCIGIQGQTGAGKSTLMSLLLRFYDPDQGCIYLDGVDIRNYRIADLRNQFSIVLQEPILFATTVRENISYGQPDALEAQIVEAAKQANAHEFIMNLSEGYNTEIGERGMTLSGGERQRIALARAFLKNTPILILDEPTSSVDIQTESLIVEALDRLMKDRTTFIIAHRLSTLNHCQIRFILENRRLTLLGKNPPREIRML